MNLAAHIFYFVAAYVIGAAVFSWCVDRWDLWARPLRHDDKWPFGLLLATAAVIALAVCWVVALFLLAVKIAWVILTF